jgi:glycosyltransferase involved in cell wall biosynthesis
MEKKRLKIGFYNPYFDGYGGGEVYMLTLASHWAQNHDVSLFWDDESVLDESQERFGLDLSRVTTVPNVFKNGSLFTKLMKSKEYDYIVFLTDGSVPLSFAKHNILHFQVPFEKIHVNQFKRFDYIVCNSLFTQRHLDPYFGKSAIVIYPPVQLIHATKLKKEKTILSVGRFTSYHEAKKQHVMIEAFIKMKKDIPGWKLILAGGLLDSDKYFFDELEKKSKGHNIQLMKNINFETIQDLYKKSSIYWHAAGYKEENPQYVEHFGISTVEAMSAGCVPIVYAGGGQLEIVDESCGRLWKMPEQLIEHTIKIIEDKTLNALLQKEAITRSERFSGKVFYKDFDELLSYEKR